MKSHKENSKSPEEYLKHFRTTISKELVEYVNNVALLKSRYLFINKIGNIRTATCSHCDATFPFGKASQNKIVICPACHSTCRAKHLSMPRKNLIDEAYIVFFEKSICDPETIVARGIHLFRNYSNDYRNVQTMFSQEALYVFTPGSAVMLKYGWWTKEHTTTSSVYSLFPRHENQMECSCSKESIERAVENTVFRYSCWEEYFSRYRDMIKFFNLFSRYPIVEQLTKVVGTDLIEDKIYGEKTFGVLNWNAKTVFRALKMNRAELKEIRENNLRLSFVALKILQLARKTKSKKTMSELVEIGERFNNHITELAFILKHTASLDKTLKYIEKQISVRNPSEIQTLHTWKDYIKDCIQLQYDLSRNYVLYPRNLYAAHQNTIRQRQVKADETLNAAILVRYKKLMKKYSFSSMELFIRPAKSSTELSNEGKVLNHCVGTYARQYADGGTDILFIRRFIQPDVPFYTVEIRNNRILQVRTKHNITPEEQNDNEVIAFLEAFKAAKIEGKQVKVSVPA